MQGGGAVWCGVGEYSWGKGTDWVLFLVNVIGLFSLPKKLMDSKQPDWQKGERLIKFWPHGQRERLSAALDLV